MVQMAPAMAQNDLATNHMIIKFASNSIYSFEAEDVGCSFIEKIDCINAELWCIPDELTIGNETFVGEEAIADYFASLGGVVEYAEPDWLVEEDGIPNDPAYNQLWGMERIDAPQAWDTQTGSTGVVIGVIDSGVDWAHPDLVDNIWQNLGEDADGDGSVLEWDGSKWVFDPGDENGIDEDGNGYVDDFVGWDFYHNDNDPYDICGHGTHVAGTIGAQGNNAKGVSGVCWDVKMIALKFLELNPVSGRCTGATSNGVLALEYAVMMGAPISNNSWGGRSYSQAMVDALEVAEQHNHLFVAAAGNSGVDNDIIPHYPASYTNANILSVAATDQEEALSVYPENQASNFGSTSVDLSAPGSDIYSTFPNNNYALAGGTSMAAPHVAGSAALLLSECGPLTWMELKGVLMASIDPIPSLSGKCISEGRLNLASAMQRAANTCSPSPPNCLTPDSLVLVDLYNLTDGANWTNPWNLFEPMSEWNGIVLTADGCGVRSLSLSNNNLIGTIPASLGSLASLFYLDLSRNQLSGDIPIELGNLGSLGTLDLEHNELNGSIPVELGNLSSMYYLALSGNQLSGSIPPELGSLTALTDLYLYANQLNASIPAELGNLSNLNYLWLHNNQLSGCYPQDLCNLNLNSYNFTGNAELPSGGSNQSFADFCAGNITCNSSCLASDSLALVALYNSSNGPNWTNTWDLSQPVSTWYGVSLSLDACNVVELNIQSNQLSGSLPSELGNLTELTYLNLQANQLSGTIPMEIGSLSKLTLLNFASNQLSGTIPIEISNLSNLNVLELSANQLSGTIPMEIGNLSNLTYLYLGANQLSGTIPVEIGSLSNLIHLYLDDNQLSDQIVLELGNLSNLTHLSLRNNMLSGSIPPELGELSNLTYLWLDRNDLNGSIPPELGNLSNLTSLVLFDNQLSYSIPAELGSLSSLSQIYLNDNQLIGCYPESLCDLNLIAYNFINNSGLPNNGSDQGFDDFCAGNAPCPNQACLAIDSLALVALYNSTNGPNWINTWDLSQPVNTWYGVNMALDGCSVIDLQLGNNGLVGSLPDELGNLSNIYGLWLYNNQISGSIPTSLGNLSNMSSLFLYNNQLSGSIPRELGNATALRTLGLDENELTGSIPIEFGNLINLTSLSLDNNQLTGNIPSEFGNLLSLRTLNIYNNDLTGSLPASMGNLSQLEWFKGQSNNLSGSIPASFGNLGNLTLLYLQNNDLTGAIPATLGNLSNLNSLALGANDLSGGIPDELGNLGSLKFLYLEGNQLVGMIPDALGNLSNLQTLHLYNNQLEGCYPQSLCNLPNLSNYAFYGNIGLTDDGSDAGFDAFCAGNAPCPNEICLIGDSLALVALYNSTNGPNWTNTWDLSQPVNTWEGITLSSDGCNVKEIYMYSNNLTGSLPAELGNLFELEQLDLQANDIGGIIPSELGNLSKLKNLRLNANELTGNIPPELGNLMNLEYLYLLYNNLTGNIPPELGNMSSLLQLYLYNNNLSGSIPPELGNLSSLMGLDLAYNQLSGNIPSSLGDLMNLSALELNNNNLIGVIPATLGNLPNLNYLRLQNNQLSGCYSMGLCAVSNYDFRGNASLPDGGSNQGFVDFCAGTAPTCTNPICNASDLELGSDMSIPCGGEIFLSTNLPNMAYTLWDYEGMLISTAPDVIVGTPGLYRVVVADSCGNTAKDSITIIQEGSCVWPGDLNNDNIVNTFDVLTWGITNGNTGPSRSEASLNWVGQSCNDWATATFNGVNDKHSDANGNGTVELSDLDAVTQNYGSIHGANSLPNGNTIPSFIAASNALVTDAGTGNGEMLVDIVLSEPLNNTHGLTWSIHYDIDLAEDEITFEYDPSALGDEGTEVEVFQYHNVEQNTVDIAITRTDGQDVSCGVSLGLLRIAEDNVIIWDDSLLTVNILIPQPVQMDNSGNINYLSSNNNNEIVSIAGMVCPATHIHNYDDYLTGIYQAEGDINSSAQVSNNVVVDYKAGNSLNFYPGFSVNNGGEFTASIEACTANRIAPEISLEKNAEGMPSIQVYLPQDQHIAIEVWNANEQEVRHILNESYLQKGEHQYSLDTTSFDKGQYEIQIKSTSEVLKWYPLQIE